MRIKKHINAIHDDHLESLLENIGYLNKIKMNEVRCKFCKDIIKLDNISSIFPESGSIKFICESPPCIYELKKYLQEHEFN